MTLETPKVLSSSKISKRLFSKEEDNILKALLTEKDKPNWKRIAQSLPGRTSRQCRERWKNYLSPKISNPPWTKEEDEQLIHSIEIYGHQWAKIAHLLGSRSDVNVKNRWVRLMRQKKSNSEKITKTLPLENNMTQKETNNLAVNQISSNNIEFQCSSDSNQQKDSFSPCPEDKEKIKDTGPLIEFWHLEPNTD